MPIDWKKLGIPEMYKRYADPEKALDHYWSKRKTSDTNIKTYTCPCSRRTYSYTSFYQHKKSKKHLQWLEENGEKPENGEKQENGEKPEKPDDLD